MLKSWLAAVLLILGGVAEAQDFDPVRVEAYADGLIREAIEANNVAGATIAVVKDGRVILAKGYGIARIAPRPQRTDADTLFQIASISKTPVYLAIMQMAQDRQLKLDDPVNIHLPPKLRLPDQGYKQPVTIRHLMTHSAGFEDSALGHLFVDKPERLTPIQSYLASHRVNRINPPGVQTSYSNYALALLGAVIEQKSGMDFASYMEARILRPLGMARATYRGPYTAALGKKLGLPAPMDAAIAANITQQLGGEPPKWKEVSPEWTTMAPAGGLRASANDMAQYALALSDPARLEAAGVLKAATFAQMLQPGIDLPGAARHGFMNYYFQGGRTGFGHDGAMAYGASNLIIVPNLKLGIFVSTNGKGGFAFAGELVRRMLKDFAPLPELQPVRNDETRKAAQALGGHWIVNRRPWGRTEAAFSFFVSGFTVTPEKDGDIVIGGLMGSARRFQPLGDGVWQSPTRYGRRIAMPAADGTMTQWADSGSGGAVRAGLWQRPLWMAILLVLTLIVASVAAVRGIWQLARPVPASRSEAYAQRSATVASLFWAVGLGGFLAILIGAIPDQGASLIFSYPGPMVALAWIIAVAVVLTIFALPGIAALRGAGRWSRWRKAKHAALLILFALAAYGCWTIGLVGYSGF